MIVCVFYGMVFIQFKLEIEFTEEGLENFEILCKKNEELIDKTWNSVEDTILRIQDSEKEKM